MPPRYAYWTIIAGGLPTAFRAADRDDLLPTFQRIKEKHPDAQMKWFARGKLWESPEAARAAQHRGGRDRTGGDRHRTSGDRTGADRNRTAPDRIGQERDRTSRDRTSHERDRTPRDRSWRPGGEHRDPRQKFIDAKKDRNTRIRKERWEHKNTPRPPNPNPKPWQQKKPWMRGQDTEEPRQPKRPPGPNREPKPSENPEPTAPPHPTEPIVPPPGPPEQGRGRPRPFRAQRKFDRGPRRNKS